MSYLSSWLFLLKSRWIHTWITEPTFPQIGYMLHTLSVLINTTENTPLQFSQMLKQMVKWKKKIFLIWTIFTSLHDKNYCTHFSYCLHPSLLSLSRVFWPAAVAANRRALLMKVLKESGKWQRKRKKKNVAPQHPQIQSSGKKEGDSKRQCSFSERALSVFSSSSAPKCWSHKWCWGLRAVPAVCVNSKLKILLTRRYFMCSIFIKWL